MYVCRKDLELYRLIAFVEDKFTFTEKASFLKTGGERGENCASLHFLFSCSVSKRVLPGGCLFNPFPNKPWFLYVFRTSLLKTHWE